MSNESQSAAVVRARRVGKTYGSGAEIVTALDGIDLDIEAEKLTAIMGPSGSGKSTLMHVLAGLDNATTGSVLVGRTEVTELDDDALTELRRREIGFVFQSFNLVPTLDVMGNILLPFELDGTKPDTDRVRWIHELLGELGLGGLARRRPSELSGGQQQRVAIVRALAMRPTIIFADEPTGNLDSRSSREVLNLLVEATRRHGQTVVLVTHDPIAAAHADRIVFIADGRIADDVGPSSAQALSDIILGLEVRR
jgi:putative ABC transport system ATP-binding protein